MVQKLSYIHIHHLGATPKNQVLIATDVISRGIDVPQVRVKGVPHAVCSMPSLTEVTLVVNYELPISFNDQWRGVNMEP